jgi:uncharacterized protein
MAAESMRYPEMLRHLYMLPRKILIIFVRIYKLVLSPHIGAACRYQPTCSSYSIEALTKYGAIKGTILTLYRIGRCHPWGGHGYDPPRWFGEEAPAPDTAHEA